MNTASILVNRLSEREFVNRFRERGLTHRLWRHPFLTRIARGDYTFEDLRVWAIQAGRIDQAFAEILERMLGNSGIHSAHRAPLYENWQDELGHGDPAREHFTLFRDVLSLCNVSEEEYNATLVTEGTRQILSLLLTAASDTGNPLRSVTLMANEELLCPNEFPIFVEAFGRLASDRQCLRYFDEHIEADVGHADDLMRIVYRMAVRMNVTFETIDGYQDEDLEANWAFYESMPCGCEFD